MTEFGPGNKPNNLPDWLADVPMTAAEPIWMPIGGAKLVPLSVVFGALNVSVGTQVGIMAIDPALAHEFARFTENPAWRNLPTELTWIERSAEDSWDVHVGDYSRTFSKDELQHQVRETLSDRQPK